MTNNKVEATFHGSDFPVSLPDTPIFWSLLQDERFSGLDFPVNVFLVANKPNGQSHIKKLDKMSTGIVWKFSKSYLRDTQY